MRQRGKHLAPRPRRRPGRAFGRSLPLALAMVLVTATVAFAADLETAVAEVDSPANEVTVTQGQTANFSIRLSASGAIKCVATAADPATATVHTVFSLDAAGTLASGTPSSAFNFFAGTAINATNCNVTWTGAPTPYSQPASVSAHADTPPGDYQIVLSVAAGTTSTTTPSGPGGSLDDDIATSITVKVVAAAQNLPPQMTLTGDDAADEGDTKSYSFTQASQDAEGPFTLDEATCGLNGAKSYDAFDTTTGAGSFDCTFPDGLANSTVSVSVSNSAGSDTDSIVVTISNVDPSVGAISGLPADPIPVGTLVTGCVAFTDPAEALDEPFTAQFDWNAGDWDGAGPIYTSPDPNSIDYWDDACASHTYTAAGVYAVQASVADKDGGSGQSPVHEFVVVYDPTAGFVTGGGWIVSPKGACLLESCTYETVGKANFGFVSKYQRGANVPTGNTEFQFKAGDLNFKSTVYEWLVVQGGSGKAQYKGSGTINGSGDYGFMLTVSDGGPKGDDKFRIKIWDKNADDTVVYDNQMGGADNADATTVIGGGSIVIHAK